MSAKPTVGRFALGPPHNVQLRKKIKVPFSNVRIPFREIATSRYALLAMTGAEYRFAWFNTDNPY